MEATRTLDPPPSKQAGRPAGYGEPAVREAHTASLTRGNLLLEGDLDRGVSALCQSDAIESLTLVFSENVTPIFSHKCMCARCLPLLVMPTQTK